MVCLFCKREQPETDEHVFPAPFGQVGFIVRFVCKRCNDRLGNEVDHRADRDARLSHARHSSGLPIRHQSIRSVDAATDGAGQELRTLFHKGELAAVVAPQPDGDELIVGRDLMPEVTKGKLRAELRKAGETISDDEVNEVTAEILRLFDAATTGEAVKVSYRGLTISVPRLELQNDTAGAVRHDEPDAIQRVSGKIAFEVAHYAIGGDPMLGERYDAFRNWILSGEPDHGSSVEILREPNLDGGDTELRHSVQLVEENGLLFAVIAFFGAYIVRVRIGEAPGLAGPWMRVFSVGEP